MCSMSVFSSRFSNSLSENLSRIVKMSLKVICRIKHCAKCVIVVFDVIEVLRFDEIQKWISVQKIVVLHVFVSTLVLCSRTLGKSSVLVPLVRVSTIRRTPHLCVLTKLSLLGTHHHDEFGTDRSCKDCN